MKYAGTQGEQIKVVSDEHFFSEKLNVVELPEEIREVSGKTLITDYRFIAGKFIPIKKKNKENIKVAFVSNWKMACGIATYSEAISTAIIPYINDFCFFIEDNEMTDVSKVGGIEYDESKFIACWKRGKPLDNLAQKIKEYDPDVVLIQHEFGIFSPATYWLALLTQLSDYRVIVIMHSVYHHIDKIVCEAGIPEMIVHLDDAKKALVDKGINSKIYVIPHGCDSPKEQNKLWNIYKSDHTIVQFGFGFRYKRFDTAIKAIGLLKEKYPDIFFTTLFSESVNNKTEHDFYFNELKELITTLYLENNVAIVRGFQNDTVIDAYCRTNKIAIFPYGSHPEHKVYGASGAARMAMAKGLPIVTTNIPHFSDLPSIKAETAEEMAQAIDALFSDKQKVANQVSIQNEYLIKNSWDEIARKYVQIFMQ